MTVEILHAANRSAWLAARGQDVTASQVAALFTDGDGRGIHPYTSLYELWHGKAGNLPPVAETDAMVRGTEFEEVAVRYIRRQHPDWLIQYNAADLTYYRDPALRLGATPDLIVDHPERGRGVIQIKTMALSRYRAEWRDEDGEERPPLWIELQASLERHLVPDAKWSAVAAFAIGGQFDVLLPVPIIEVPVVDGLVETMGRKSLAFWRSIEAGKSPSPDFGRDGDVIAAAHAHEVPDDALDLTADATVETLLRARAEWSDLRRQAADGIRRIDAELRHRMADAPVAYLAEGRTIQCRTERRSGRFVPPSSGRRLRLPKPLPAEEPSNG